MSAPAPALNHENLETYQKFLDLILANMCAASGARYAGIMRSQYSSMPALVMFTSLKTRGSMTLPLLDVSPMALATRVRESDLSFETPKPWPRLAPTPGTSESLG